MDIVYVHESTKATRARGSIACDSRSVNQQWRATASDCVSGWSRHR